MPKSKTAPQSASLSTLKIGDKAPAFSCPAYPGEEVSLKSLKGQPFVLYFYPKDNTSGCTVEACDFRDALPQFKKLGIKVIGISKDSLASHEKFAAKFDLPFTLASDEDVAACTAYGVWVEKSMYGRKYMGVERSTFLIDEKGILRAQWRKVSIPGHVEEVAKAAKDFIEMSIEIVNNTSLQKAVDLLRDGKLVAFPTETVYGLGADATNDHAVASIYAAKGRPSFNPLIIHLPDAASVRPFVEWNDRAQILADRFWPGPMTLILPRIKNCPVSLLTSAGLDSLAVRVPSHPHAIELLRRVGRPIAAPSANASGKLSPTTAAHVFESLGSNVSLILDGGATQVGVESTVIDLTTARPTILRPGFITREMVEDLIGPTDIAAPITDNAIKSPGQMTSHYAPSLPVRLNAMAIEKGEAFLAFGPIPFSLPDKTPCLNLSPSCNLQEAAANLFSMMRQLDLPGLSCMAVSPIPMTGLGIAINDRLNRAAAPRE